MAALISAIDKTPIIDHHAHNLLLPNELDARELISITTEAGGAALAATKSSLAHIRAVKQLSEILGCASDWTAVQRAIAEKRTAPDDLWARRCFQGIETVLIDDGLDAETVHPWDWHHRLTRSKCKRIVRIEKVAETMFKECFARQNALAPGQKVNGLELFYEWTNLFRAAIEDAIQDPDVVGFKSVICYRTGLAIPNQEDFLVDLDSVEEAMGRIMVSDFSRLEDKDLCPYIVHLAAKQISHSKGHFKPFQFHTGLGDNDITLSLSSPAHLQPFIEAYPKVPIVLLHASYPFTKEAAYLASVYDHVYLDIGEVFPMISQEGQENVIRESLELCPSEKLTWSTDGHWFPETYLLAVIQIREGMKKVLGENVARRSLTVSQAVQIVEDIFFHTANRVYDLGLRLEPLTVSNAQAKEAMGTSRASNIQKFYQFLKQNPSLKYLRIQWVDYTATLRLRIVPIKQAILLFEAQKSVSTTKACLGLLQTDIIVPGFSPTGECHLIPDFTSLRLGQAQGYATVQGDFHEHDGSPVSLCPRTALRRVLSQATEADLSIVLGFEIEVVFVRFIINELAGTYEYDKVPLSRGHAWSSAGAVRNRELMDIVEQVVDVLEKAGIEILMIHPEGGPAQYEFVTGPLPALEAVDTLIASKEIICAVAEKYGFRATCIPKPVPEAAGTGAHVHLSMTPEKNYVSFYAGVLRHLRAIAAFTLSGKGSYERLQDGCWAGGRYVVWGTQNREAPLRKIDESHWEIKCMDGLANPYLAMAAVIAAGVKGVNDGEKLDIKDCGADPATLSPEQRKALGIKEMMPASIEEALQCLGEDKELQGVLGGEVVGAYLAIKHAEIKMLANMNVSEEQRRIFLLERY